MVDHIRPFHCAQGKSLQWLGRQAKSEAPIPPTNRGPTPILLVKWRQDWGEGSRATSSSFFYPCDPASGIRAPFDWSGDGFQRSPFPFGRSMLLAFFASFDRLGRCALVLGFRIVACVLFFLSTYSLTCASPALGLNVSLGFTSSRCYFRFAFSVLAAPSSSFFQLGDLIICYY